MAEPNALEMRQLRESMARIIDGAVMEARRLGLQDLAVLLREASETARRDLNAQGEEGRAAPWQAEIR